MLYLDEADGERVVLRAAKDGGPESPVPSAWDHPHLLGLRGMTSAGELVTEYAPGGCLATLIARRGPLPPGEVVTLLVPLARALTQLHDHGVVHGDVSPDNVLFRADTAPILADPGLTRGPAEAPRLGGTPGFAAPEAMRTGTTSASDVYGWGALAWFALTGQEPEPEGTRLPLPLLYPDITPAFSRLVDDALAYDPALRPPAAELADELLASQQAAPLDSMPAVPPENARLMHTVIPAVRPPGVQGGRGARSRRAAGGGASRGRRPAGVWPRGRRQGHGAGAIAIGPGAWVAPRDGGRGRRGGRPWGTGGATAGQGRPRGVRLAALLIAVLAAVGMAWGAVRWLDAGQGPEAGTVVPVAASSGTVEAPPPTQRESVEEVEATGAPAVVPPPNPSAAATPPGAVERPQETAGPHDAGREPDPAQALVALDAARTKALVASDAKALGRISAAGSPARREDDALLASLLASGQRYGNYTSRVEGLRVVAREGATARVAGTATSGPAKLLDARGRAVATTNATRASLTWVLVRDGAGWRVSEVLRG